MIKPNPLRDIVFEKLTNEPLSLDSLVSKLTAPRDEVRNAVKKLVERGKVVNVGLTRGNRYIYRAAHVHALPSITKTDPAAAWLFNKVMK